MSKLVRFLSRRRTGKGIKRGIQQPENDSKKANKNVIVCTVMLLDGTDVTIELPKGSLGDVLYQRVFYHLDLLETSYFGLQYTDSGNVNHWLDATKKIKKQVQIGPPFTLRLRVKFFPTEPSALKEELTRYQFFQQCKSDILNGTLTCPDDAMAVELAAYALQSELGDFDEEDHTPAFISEFRFMPNQSEEMELEIFNKYQSLSGQRMTPDKAELQYLLKVKRLDLYGVDMHYVLGRDGLPYKLGLTPTGVLVFEGEEKIGLFYWPKITKFNFKKKKLILVVVEDNEGMEQPTEIKQEHTFVFRTENPKACKHLWKCAIEHHTFFRVVVQPLQERSKQGFIRLGSRFRYSGRTQFEQLNKNQARRSVRFERQPSKRFSRRQSLEAKDRIKRRKPPTSLVQPNGNIKSGGSPLDSAPACNSPPSQSMLSSPNGANMSLVNGSGSPELTSPMDRLDNLISAGTIERSSGRDRTLSARDRTPSAASPTVLEHSEAAQAKIKGLSDTPVPPPRPTKDVNLYQNNQVKVIGNKEKVPIEIKSNILKARADEEKHSVKETNTLTRNVGSAYRVAPPEMAAKPPRSHSIGHSAPATGHSARHGFSFSSDLRSQNSRGPHYGSPSECAPNRIGGAVMQEDDDVSTESEDESPTSPINSQQKEHTFNGTRLPRNKSTSSSRSIPSPVSNKGYASLSRDRGAQSPKTSQLASLPRDSPINSGATRSPMTTSIGSAASHSRLDTLSTSHESLDLTNIPPEWSAPPEVPPVLTPDANANTNPFFDSPEIRAFLFGTSDSVLGELPSVSTVAKGSSTVAKGSSKAHCAPNSSSAQHNLNLLLHSSPSALLESVVDSPMSISPAGSVAPLASCEDDADLCSPGEASGEGSKSKKHFTSRQDSKTNGDVFSANPLPTPAPRKYEKRVCVTTEL